MKICYLSDAADIHTQRWVKYFKDAGHEIHLISLQNPFRSLDYKNINLHLVKEIYKQSKVLKYSVNALFLLKQIKKLIKEIKPDIIHGHAIRDYTIIGILTGFHPFVATAWGGDVLIIPNQSKIMKYTVPFALRRADIITCDGENTKEAMIKMGIESKKIDIIMHGTDTNKFKPFYAVKKIREELAISNSKIVISTRRLGHIHDVETLIKAIPLVLKPIPNAKFIIVGGGPQKKYLLNLAQSLNVSDATRFVGWLANDKMPQYLGAADIYVSTSLSDSGLAAGTAEAMACELPVVITDFGDNRKWVEDGVNGFIVPPKNPKALAEKIVYSLKNKDLKMEFGVRNRKIIEERNNHYIEMEKMGKIYTELVGGYKR